MYKNGRAVHQDVFRWGQKWVLVTTVLSCKYRTGLFATQSQSIARGEREGERERQREREREREGGGRQGERRVEKRREGKQRATSVESRSCAATGHMPPQAGIPLGRKRPTATAYALYLFIAKRTYEVRVELGYIIAVHCS